MGQLQHAVMLLFWGNVAVLAVFGFLVFCWFCETVNKWIGDDGSEEKMRRVAERRAQRQVTPHNEEKTSEQQVTEVSAQIQAAIAEEVAKYANGTSP